MAWKTKEPVSTEIEPGRKYTPSELDDIATAILREDAKNNPIKEYPKILFEEHIRNRWRREVQTAAGVPDPSIVQGQFYKSHPQGRKVNSDEARKVHGAGFYR